VVSLGRRMFRRHLRDDYEHGTLHDSGQGSIPCIRYCYGYLSGRLFQDWERNCDTGSDGVGEREPVVNPRFPKRTAAVCGDRGRNRKSGSDLDFVWTGMFWSDMWPDHGDGILYSSQEHPESECGNGHSGFRGVSIGVGCSDALCRRRFAGSGDSLTVIGLGCGWSDQAV